MLTDYAKQLLARSETRAASERFKAQPVTLFRDSSVKTINTFRIWEAGFNAHEQSIPLEVIKNSHARQGWLAAEKIDKLSESGEFDNLAPSSILERLTNEI